ncbi:MAG TPA: hypothetical protein VHT95_06915, partial [Vicinamibacterales bacterium]|nr:hypothetical protein [Vicinamibacterales bacterium]
TNTMLKLIETSVAAIEQRLVLVAPLHVSHFDAFRNVTNDTAQNRRLVEEMQRLRGSIYLEEGNVKHDQLTSDGRHRTPEDDLSWHLLMTDQAGHVRSCALYFEHENASTISDLRLKNCPLVKRAESRDKVKVAVEAEMARARAEGLRFAEVGGWAISKERRGSPEGLMIALATYALSRMLGGAIGITTANVAHSCSSILRRLGGAYLEFEGQPIPSYFDPKYNTEIDLLRFDSRHPSAKYAALIETVIDRLSDVSVVAGTRATMVSRVDVGGSLTRPRCAA